MPITIVSRVCPFGTVSDLLPLPRKAPTTELRSSPFEIVPIRLLIAFVAKEMNNGWTKISMRSKENDVAAICKQFDGGGHKLAAGCTIKCGIDEAVKKILGTIQ